MANPSVKPRIEALAARLLADSLASLRGHARCMHDAEKRGDPEIVHAARVAVRRMRAALRVFPLEDRAGESRVMQARKALKTLGRVLGEARDWDVIATQLLLARRALLVGEIGAAGFARLRKQVLRAQGYANAAARKFVSGASFEAALVPIDRLRVALEATESQPRRSLSALHWIKRQQARVLRRAAHLSKLDAPAGHKLRIEGKRLRYATELCAWEGGKKWLRALKNIQDTLGKASDARMLAKRIGALDAAAGRVLEAHERACVEREMPRIAKLFGAWARAKAPD